MAYNLSSPFVSTFLLHDAEVTYSSVPQACNTHAALRGFAMAVLWTFAIVFFFFFCETRFFLFFKSQSQLGRRLSGGLFPDHHCHFNMLPHLFLSHYHRGSNYLIYRILFPG